MAQSIAGTNLAVTAVTPPRRKAARLRIKWDGVSWTDETEYLHSASGNMGYGSASRGMVLPGVIATATMDVVLINTNNRFSQFNSSSPIYSYISDGKMHMTPITLDLGFYDDGTPERLVQFTGYIDTVDEDTAGKTVTLQCSDRSGQIKEEPRSCAMQEDKLISELMATFCGLVGITSGEREIDTIDIVVPWGWLETDDVWPEMKKLALAGAARLSMTKENKLRCEGPHHWLDGTDHTTSQHTFTVSSFKNIHPKLIRTDVYKSVLVELNPREVSDTSVVYDRDDAPFIPPNSSITLTCELDYPCKTVYSPVEDTDFVTVTPGGRRVTGAVTFQTTKYGQRVELIASNSDANYGLFLIMLKIRGEPLMGGPRDEILMESAAGYAQDERVKPIRGNMYIQTRSHGEMLCDLLLDLLDRPKALFSVKEQPAIPWLELGDLVTVQEADSGINHLGFILAFDWSFASGDEGMYLFDDLTLVDRDVIFYLLDYFRINTDYIAPRESYKVDDSNIALWGGSGMNAKLAVQFTVATPSINMRSIELKLNRVGNPGGRVRVVLYDDLTGLPNNPVTGWTSRWVATSQIPTGSTWIPFILPDEPLRGAGSPVRHVVLEPDSDYTYAAGTAMVNWRSDDVGSGGTLERFNAGGPTWSEDPQYKATFRNYEYALFY